ncbi:hypothetical protein TWF703_005433 [Orbilia oligospora]|uniref:EGF-like domain-containing protein n=1 Tax=Orbilia oligospora TaxID=2813651 RepID=A0A7C8JWQ9_ORBOL|nr:hypothetical protein TWF703_005433 [Orbilia oligospora]
MRVAALGFHLLSISSVLAYPFKGGAGTELGSVLVKRGQELCPALYQEGPIQFFAFPQSVFVAVTSTTRHVSHPPKINLKMQTTTRSSTASTSTLSTTTVSTTLSTTRATTSSTTTTTTTRITTSSTTTTAFQVVCSSTPPSCEANGCSGTVAPAGTGNPTCKSINFFGCACIPSVNTPGYTCPNQSCGANNCAGSFNNNGASATCKNYGAGCACAPTAAMAIGQHVVVILRPIRAETRHHAMQAVAQGRLIITERMPPVKETGLLAVVTLPKAQAVLVVPVGAAMVVTVQAAFSVILLYLSVLTCGPLAIVTQQKILVDHSRVVVPTDATANGMVILVLLGVQGTLWDAAVRLLRGPAGPAVTVRIVIAIIVRAPLPVTTPTLSALMPMRRATVIPRTIPAVIRKAAIRTGVMDNGTRVALLVVPVISSAAAVIRQGTHAAQERAASAMAAPDEGAVMASGAVLGDTLLVHAITTLSGVILIGMRVGRVVDMNSDRTRTNASPNSDLLANLPSNWNDVASSITIISWVVRCQFYVDINCSGASIYGNSDRNTGPNSWDLQGANSYFNDKVSSYKCWLDPLTFCGDFPDIALRNTSSGLRRIVDFNTNINPSFRAIENILPTNPDTMKACFIFTLALTAAVTASPIERGKKYSGSVLEFRRQMS